MDLKFVEWIQTFRTDFLDFIFKIITEFGDEMAFFVISAILFWVVNKKFAYRLMMIFLTSVAVNSVLKFVIGRPRPYDASNIVVSVVEKTPGFSMPSGHSQNGMALALTLNERYGKVKKWITPFLFSIAALIAFSRVYLGQHYLSDIIAGLAVTTAIYLLIIHLAPKLKIHTFKLVYYVTPLLLILMIFVPDKNLYITVAGIIGVTLGHDLELRYVNYDIKAPWYIQIIKLILGLGVALLLRAGLKSVLPYPAGDVINQTSLVLDFIRYFILTMWLTLGSMYLFKKIFPIKKA